VDDNRVSITKNLDGSMRNDAASDKETVTETTSTVIYPMKINVNPTGIDLTLRENLFDRNQLAMMGQDIKQDLLATKYVLNMTILPVPYLSVGQLLNITGNLEDGSGNSIALDGFNWLITEIDYNYDESSDTPVYLSNIEAIAFKWS
jgi:hypothetical protein